MQMNTQTMPCELVIRWNPRGVLEHFHASHQTVVTTDAGVVVDTQPGPMLRASAANAGAFPLDALLSQAQSGALLAAEEAWDAKAAAEAERDAAIAAQAATARTLAETVEQLAQAVDALARLQQRAGVDEEIPA